MKKNNEAVKKRGWYARLSFSQRMSLWGVIFLLPWILGILTFFISPMVRTIYYAFFDMSIEGNGFGFAFVGLENFTHAFTVDPDFTREIVDALSYVALNVPIQLFVSLFIAIMLNGKYFGRGFFRLIFFIPIILATNLLAVDLTYSVGGEIAAEESLQLVDTAWLLDMFTGSLPPEMSALIMTYVSAIFNIVTTSGIQILIFLSGLQVIAPSLYEVAKIEGCTQFESFCKITLPMISPMMLVCLIYSLTEAFANAEVTETISTVTFTNGNYGLGAAMSAIYLIVSVVVVLVAAGIMSKGVFYYDN